jgi:hypothetical protein
MRPFFSASWFNPSGLLALEFFDRDGCEHPQLSAMSNCWQHSVLRPASNGAF